MDPAKRKRPRPGDLLELACTGGYIYVHYLGRHEHFGDAIYVYPKVFPDAVTDCSSLAGLDGYITFYPARSAANQGLTRVVGACPFPAGAAIPTTYRRAGAMNREGNKVLAWVIVRDERETLSRKLTKAEKRLPIAAVWNHEYLIEQVEAGWRPEHEG
jgi:hypothetical protein